MYRDTELLTQGTDYNFTSASVIRLTKALTENVRVTIRRDTNLQSRAVDFVNAAELTEADLDNSASQVFYAMQETKDNSLDTIDTTLDGHLSANSKRLKNVSLPIEVADATNKGYTDGELNKVVSITETARETSIVKAAEALSSAGDARIEADRATVQAERSRGEAERAAVEAVRASANATLSGLPLGSYVWYPASSLADVQDKQGLLVPNGRELNREDYSDLWRAISNNELPSVTEVKWQAGQKGVFSTGNLSTTFRLPSIGGYFVRIAGEADPDHATRELGSVQLSENKRHKHSVVETDLGTVTTTQVGGHVHTGSMNPAGSHRHKFSWGGGSQNWPANFVGGDAVRGKTVANSQYNTQIQEGGEHTHILVINEAGEHVHTIALGKHIHEVSEEGNSESRPANVWMQPYLVWHHAKSSALGGFCLRGAWDIGRNTVIGDALNTSLEAGVAPVVEADTTADGMGYLALTEGTTALTGSSILMRPGDRVVWYGNHWTHMQNRGVNTINEANGDVVLTTADIKRTDDTILEQTLASLSMYPTKWAVMPMHTGDINSVRISNTPQLAMLNGENYWRWLDKETLQLKGVVRSGSTAIGVNQPALMLPDGCTNGFTGNQYVGFDAVSPTSNTLAYMSVVGGQLLVQGDCFQLGGMWAMFTSSIVVKVENKV